MFTFRGNLLRAYVMQKTVHSRSNYSAGGGSLLRHYSALSARSNHVMWPWSIGSGNIFLLMYCPIQAAEMLLLIFRTDFRQRQLSAPRVSCILQSPPPPAPRRSTPDPSPAAPKWVTDLLPRGDTNFLERCSTNLLLIS